MRHRALLLPALLLGSTVLASAPAAAAGGLFDFLFGSRPAPGPAYSAPLEFDVRPRGFRSERAERRRFEHKKALARRNAKPIAKIDPVADPDWRFRDPTLRRGDIIVLKEGPVVFEGPSGDEHEAADFAPLAKSRLPTSLQRQVRMMVAGRWIDGDTKVAAKRDRKPPRETWAAAAAR